jgi:alkanesulfonate monooxygenase SsuD/methylene tetrahydromethanopterin reductase-like flavin-dependent oxidoreductase (luciferase family)
MNMANPKWVGGHPLEAWTTLAALAAVTRRIKLGPLVGCYAYRRPTVLAKMATTVDIISEGRLVLGLGAGWHEDEFNGFMGGFPPAPERLRGLRETLEICTGMLGQERFSYNGKMYRVENVLNSPQPVQKPVPVMVGGGGERVTLALAARYAHISHFFAGDTKSLEAKLAALAGHCDKVGRNFDSIRKGTGMTILMGGTIIEAEEKLKKVAVARGTTMDALRQRIGQGLGTPSEVASALGEYVDKGIGLITLSFPDMGDMPVFAERVMPTL